MLKDDKPIESERGKMKFLDNLFDSKEEVNNHNDSTFERTYIKLEGTFEEEKIQNKISREEEMMLRKINNVFGLKTWVGTFLSFFFLCFVFNFKLILVIPLLFTALLIYAVMTLGYKYSYHYIKKIRSYVKRKIRSINMKNDYEEINDYRLMEI